MIVKYVFVREGLNYIHRKMYSFAEIRRVRAQRSKPVRNLQRKTVLYFYKFCVYRFVRVLKLVKRLVFFRAFFMHIYCDIQNVFRKSVIVDRSAQTVYQLKYRRKRIV